MHFFQWSLSWMTISSISGQINNKFNHVFPVVDNPCEANTDTFAVQLLLLLQVFSVQPFDWPVGQWAVGSCPLALPILLDRLDMLIMSVGWNKQVKRLWISIIYNFKLLPHTSVCVMINKYVKKTKHILKWGRINRSTFEDHFINLLKFLRYSILYFPLYYHCISLINCAANTVAIIVITIKINKRSKNLHIDPIFCEHINRGWVISFQI